MAKRFEQAYDRFMIRVRQDNSIKLCKSRNAYNFLTRTVEQVRESVVNRMSEEAGFVLMCSGRIASALKLRRDGESYIYRAELLVFTEDELKALMKEFTADIKKQEDDLHE